jgi:hypothetical protein
MVDFMIKRIPLFDQIDIRDYQEMLRRSIIKYYNVNFLTEVQIISPDSMEQYYNKETKSYSGTYGRMVTDLNTLDVADEILRKRQYELERMMTCCEDGRIIVGAHIVE